MTDRQIVEQFVREMIANNPPDEPELNGVPGDEAALQQDVDDLMKNAEHVTGIKIVMNAPDITPEVRELWSCITVWQRMHDGLN